MKNQQKSLRERITTCYHIIQHICLLSLDPPDFCKIPKSILNNDLQSLFSCNLLCFGYYVSDKQKRTYGQNKGGFIMQQLQTSFFYDIQELVRNAPLLRKYYLIFQALDLSALKDRNYGVGATGYSQHAILRAFIVKHLEGIKSVPRLIEYLNSVPPLLELCGFELGNLPDESQFHAG